MNDTTLDKSLKAEETSPRYGTLCDKELIAELKKNLIVHPILSMKEQVHGTKIDLRIDNQYLSNAPTPSMR